jgi:hypothetical protein
MTHAYTGASCSIAARPGHGLNSLTLTTATRAAGPRPNVIRSVDARATGLFLTWKSQNIGSYLFDMKKNNTKNELSTTLIPWCKKVFVGANLHRKQEVEIKQYILIGAMPIEMPS